MDINKKAGKSLPAFVIKGLCYFALGGKFSNTALAA